MEKICKIVYFDEDSVTDYVQIVAGGELENTTELLKSRDAQEAQSVQANGKVGISGIFKALLGWEAGAHEPSGLLEDHQALSADRADRQGDHAAYAAPQLCGPSARKRRGPAFPAGDARPQRYLLHAGLCAGREKDAQERL